MSPATSPETGMVDIPPANCVFRLLISFSSSSVSFSDEICKSFCCSSDEWSLENLLSTYSVQDMSVEPAGGFSFFDNLGASPTFGDGL